ncbi:MAG: NapC/NirT family cytochrome c [Gammaproteobacteria bacterium]|nr:NapC/NirT family cytochrome c [Gammaproteobacteria bacterium]
MSKRSPWWLPDFITRHVLFAMVFAGLCGIGFMVFLIEFDHYTSSEAFCTSCHSMELAAEPYRESLHYMPTSGVRASCGDCHVSPGVFAATWDHFIGGKDLFRQLFGANYDDPVINALHAPEAAFSAREWFRKRDSATCRRCHVQEAIVGKRADTLEIHREETQGKTCVDCHINLVHREVPERATFKRDAWNRMIEQEFGLEPGTAERLLAE